MKSQPPVMDLHTEELLVKYLDGTLTTSEKQEFTNFMEQSPTFAQEVRTMESFDDFLDTSQLATRNHDNIDIGFLGDMQKHFAQSAIGTEASSSIGLGTIASKSSSFFTSAPFFGKALVLVVLGGGLSFIIWRFAAPSPETPIQSSSERLNHSLQTNQSLIATPQQMAAPLVRSDKNEASGRTFALNKTVDGFVISDSTKPTGLKPAQELSDGKAQASIQSTTPAQEKLKKLIEQYEQQIRDKEQAGDITAVAFARKTLGILQRENGVLNESMMSLEQALKIAQTSKLRELEGDILGEMALLYKAMGNIDKASRTIKDCVSILTEIGGKNLNRWSKEQRFLEGQK